MSVQVFQVTPGNVRAYWDGGMENFVEAYGGTQEEALAGLYSALSLALEQVGTLQAHMTSPKTFVEYMASREEA